MIGKTPIYVPKNINDYIGWQRLLPRTYSKYFEKNNSHPERFVVELQNEFNNLPQQNIPLHIRFKVFYNQKPNLEVKDTKLVYDSKEITKETFIETIKDIAKEEKHILRGAHLQRTTRKGVEHIIAIECKPRITIESTINAIIKYTTY